MPRRCPTGQRARDLRLYGTKLTMLSHRFVGSHQSRTGKAAIHNLKLILSGMDWYFFMKEAVEFLRRGG